MEFSIVAPKKSEAGQTDSVPGPVEPEKQKVRKEDNVYVMFNDQ